MWFVFCIHGIAQLLSENRSSVPDQKLQLIVRVQLPEVFGTRWFPILKTDRGYVAQSTFVSRFKAKVSWLFPLFIFASLVTGFVVSPHKPTFASGKLGFDVNSFDYGIVSFLNHFARRSWTLDTVFYLIDSSPLATSPIFIAFWWAWFKEGENQGRNREILLQGIMGTFLIGFVVRGMALLLPFRERPLHNPTLHFQLPYNMDPDRLIGWSSFPSDHAIMWFLLATTVLLVSRRLGIFLSIYISLTLCVARMYLGIHYPTDILAGALIGIGMASLSRVTLVRRTLTHQTLSFLDRCPGVFYAALFLLTEQMMEGFASLHDIESLFRAASTVMARLV